MKTIEFGPVEEKVREQMARCAVDAYATVLCADNHYGYSQPVGGVVAYYNHVSPSGVGYDIACGNKAVLTDLDAADLDNGVISGVMNQIVEQISFGVGRNNAEVVEDKVLDAIAGHYLPEIRKMGWMAAGQLGTVGAGNHYVDIFHDDDGRVWIGCHFGSRGFGHKVATGFLNLAHGKKWDDKYNDKMDASPTLLALDTDLGRDYWNCMWLAGDYAYAGRDWVCNKVLKILGAQSLLEVHNHHNFAWGETHDGQKLVVVRKGSTPSFPGQLSFVGSTMGEPSLIIRGVDSQQAKDALYSTVHGAGRAMSRNEAAGKKKWVKGEDGKKHPIRLGGGRIDWDAEKKKMWDANIILRGGAADEAPGAYKRLGKIIEYHKESVQIEYDLYPVGVAMAGENVNDPYAD